jgi:hypothetical protein
MTKDTVWDLYVPTNAQVLTPGISYGSVSWPGTSGVNYRGAVS